MVKVDSINPSEPLSASIPKSSSSCSDSNGNPSEVFQISFNVLPVLIVAARYGPECLISNVNLSVWINFKRSQFQGPPDSRLLLIEYWPGLLAFPVQINYDEIHTTL